MHIASVIVDNYFGRAINEYERAILLNPDINIFYYKRGLAYAALDDANQAIADFNKAIELNPNYIQAYNARAIAYLKQDHPCLALQDLIWQLS